MSIITQDNLEKRVSELAAKVMTLSVGKLLLRQHYFSAAVGRLELVRQSGSMLTNGERLCYDAHQILERYKLDETLPVHDLLHMLLHNIFRHWNVGSVEPLMWDASCDIVAEALIAQISPELVPAQNAEKRAKIIRTLSSEVKPLTAEKLYNYFTKSAVQKQTLQEYSELFSVDEHTLWHKFKPEQDKQYEPEKFNSVPVSAPDDETKPPDKSKPQQQQNSSEAEQSEKGTQQSSKAQTSAGAKQSDSLEKWLDQMTNAQKDALSEQWKEIAKQIQSELSSFGKSDDAARLALLDVLDHIDREKTDYTAFLRSFAVSGEVMKPDLDSFDVNFYCYAMELYGNVAFIEPPEYKEVKRVKDFVIAIDTSGSVSRETVRAFVRKTYTILKNEESFFSRVNIHILQCDTAVKDAAVITCEQELEKYINTLELKGFGGTDFRPVFEYIDSVRAQGELSSLKGMIYFTDGLGTFPEKPPGYEAAFVFIRGDYEKNDRPDVPPWAIKIVLEEGDVLDAP